MKAHIDLAIPALTVKLCDEDRGRLDTIIDLLRGDRPTLCSTPEQEMYTPPQKQEAQKAAEPAKLDQGAPEPSEPENNTPKAEEAKPAPEMTAQEAPAVSVDELRSKVVMLVSSGKKDATKAIINEYAGSVGAIPEDKRAEVLARLTALEG